MTRVGLPSLAVTIGTLTLYRGIAVILGPNTISSFPARYTNIGVVPIPHTFLSYSVVIFLVLAVVFGVVLHFTPFGRSLFVMGANQEAAFFAGIRVKRIKLVLFVVSGVVCALAGILYTFRLSTAVQDNGLGLELSVVAIVLLGGVSIFGGTGSIVGVVLAVFVFAGLQNALFLTNFPERALGIVTGGLLLVSVLVPNAASFARRARESLKGREGGPCCRGGGAPYSFPPPVKPPGLAHRASGRRGRVGEAGSSTSAGGPNDASLRDPLFFAGPPGGRPFLGREHPSCPCPRAGSAAAKKPSFFPPL